VGGGYALKASQTECRIKAVAGISAADMGRTFREKDGQVKRQHLV